MESKIKCVVIALVVFAKHLALMVPMIIIRIDVVVHRQGHIITTTGPGQVGYIKLL